MADWEHLTSEHILTTKVFSLTRQEFRSPRTGAPHPFHVLESGDWTNVIPITENGDVVMIRQFRVGIRGMTLEIPGGIIDPGDSDPRSAARREMIEETGYDSDDIRPLGSVHPNPAIQNNRCHLFVARGVTRVKNQELEETEAIEVVLVPLIRISDLIRAGEISHGLVLNAFHRLDLLNE